MHIKKEIIHIVWRLNFVFLFSPSVSRFVRDAFFKFFYFKPTIYIVVRIILRSVNLLLCLWAVLAGWILCGSWWLFWYLISSTKFLLIFISQKSLTTIFLYNLLLTYHKPFPSPLSRCFVPMMPYAGAIYSVWRSFFTLIRERKKFYSLSQAFFSFGKSWLSKGFELVRNEMNLINTHTHMHIIFL